VWNENFSYTELSIPLYIYTLIVWGEGKLTKPECDIFNSNSIVGNYVKIPTELRESEFYVQIKYVL
jgi:hypothetical protein